MRVMTRRSRWVLVALVALIAAPVSLSAFAASVASIVGTPRPDVFRGTAKGDVILGKGGNDKLYGLAGNDVLTGGLGVDQFWCGAGRDTANAQVGERVARDWRARASGRGHPADSPSSACACGIVSCEGG